MSKKQQTTKDFLVKSKLQKGLQEREQLEKDLVEHAYAEKQMIEDQFFEKMKVVGEQTENVLAVNVQVHEKHSIGRDEPDDDQPSSKTVYKSKSSMAHSDQALDVEVCNWICYQIAKLFSSTNSR